MARISVAIFEPNTKVTVRSGSYAGQKGVVSHVISFGTTSGHTDDPVHYVGIPLINTPIVNWAELKASEMEEA